MKGLYKTREFPQGCCECNFPNELGKSSCQYQYGDQPCRTFAVKVAFDSFQNQQPHKSYTINGHKWTWPLGSVFPPIHQKCTCGQKMWKDRLTKNMKEETMNEEESKAQKCDEDPWRNRSERMKCRTCMWFVHKVEGTVIGRCRRHAPTMSGYPVVTVTDWCGDHKVNEWTGF